MSSPLVVQRRPIDRLSALPFVVIGAGPVGLAAASHLLERGLEVLVLESGPSAGSAVRAWSHVSFFSPWEFLVDAAAARRLGRTEWPAGAPTGADFVAEYLEPLAESLGDVIRYDSRVSAVSRQGMDRTRSGDRAAVPFELRTAAGTILARAVIDASGTWGTPNPVLASGIRLADPVVSALPDVLGADRELFVGRHVAVVGAGHSAANTLIALAEVATGIEWVVRTAEPARVFGSDADELPGRASVGNRVRELVAAGRIRLVSSFEIDALDETESGVRLIGRRAGEAAVVEADVVVAATGFRPDLAMLREIRLGLDDVVEAPVALAPLIDPNLHSCGTVPPHGVDELAHPEPNFYIAGMKSYGRAPTFLLATGYEQVRSIAAELAGDSASARRVALVLPATGVCSTDTAGCCS